MKTVDDDTIRKITGHYTKHPFPLIIEERQLSSIDFVVGITSV